MSDVVKTLLDAAKLYDEAGLDGSLGADMCRKAADELEALRAENAELKNLVDHLTQARDNAVKANVDGLLAALEPPKEATNGTL